MADEIYTLTCEKCGGTFVSSVAFPVPQLCWVCSTWICSPPDKATLRELDKLERLGYERPREGGR